MESIEKKIEYYAVVFNVNLLRATLNEATEFKDYLEEAILDSDKDIIVNLSSCEHLDSTFLGVLVSGYKRLKSQNRTLVIIEPVDQSSIFLTLNSIGKIFPLYTSVKIALEDIENKKLLEKEIIELGHERAKSHQKQSNAPHKIVSFPLANSPEESVPVAINLNESNHKKKPDVEKEIKNDRVIKSKLPEENDLVLIENDDIETESENPLVLIKEEVTVEQDSFLTRDDKRDEDFIVTRPERVNEDRRFRSGSVKWEFGFS